jgi:hypothetical protein
MDAPFRRDYDYDYDCGTDITFEGVLSISASTIVETTDAGEPYRARACSILNCE